MQREIPDYSLFFGRQHVSASGATQPIDEHVLKLYLRKEHKMNFPFAARPRAGRLGRAAGDRADQGRS